jgi:hypothetical protein
MKRALDGSRPENAGAAPPAPDGKVHVACTLAAP